MFRVCLGRGDFIAGEIKIQNVMWIDLGTLIVSVIYILANIMYLAVVPLYDIATAESDRVAVVASLFLVRWNINHRGDDYDFDFACNNGLIMAGARVYYTMAQDGFLQESS
jgi:APA family basic amino acid/polyamine antiporter